MTPNPTIDEALAAGRSRLATAPFRPPLREASLLLSRVLGISEAQLIARADRRLDAAAWSRFEAMVERRTAGEPIAYILGQREFYGRWFRVDPRVLIPRPESEHLIELALSLPLPDRPIILDVGSGSGCLAITLALEISSARVLATDRSPAALAVARRNIEHHRLQPRVHLIAADLAHGIALDRFDIDLVVSNPPYIGSGEELPVEVADFEPATALYAGVRGDEVHRRLLTELASLEPGTRLLIEIGAEQRRLLERMSADSAFDLEDVVADYAGRPRIAQLRRRR